MSFGHVRFHLKSSSSLGGESGGKLYAKIGNFLWTGSNPWFEHGKAGVELTGTDRADRLFGGGGDDIINGQSGNDWLFGKSGADTINAGSGHDFVSGGHGADTINGQSGNDKLWGGSGNDTINGGRGRDLIKGGHGHDRLDGGSDNDVISGGYGDDDLRGGTGDDLVFGGHGDDRIRGGDGQDKLFGGKGDDHITGAGGNDFLAGGKGDDRLAAGGGDDRVFGGHGDDHILAGHGNDHIDGGSGYDRVVFEGRIEDFDGLNPHVTQIHKIQDTNAADGDEGQNLIKNAEIFDFSNATFDATTGEVSFKDGHAPIDLSEANIGEALLDRDGGQGNDLIVMGAGDDRIDGGDGFDIALFSGNIEDFAVIDGPQESYWVRDLNTSDGDLGSDQLSAIEVIAFDNALFDTATGTVEHFADTGARDQRVEDIVNQADVVS